VFLTFLTDLCGSAPLHSPASWRLALAEAQSLPEKLIEGGHWKKARASDRERSAGRSGEFPGRKRLLDGGVAKYHRQMAEVSSGTAVQEGDRYAVRFPEAPARSRGPTTSAGSLLIFGMACSPRHSGSTKPTHCATCAPLGGRSCRESQPSVSLPLCNPSVKDRLLPFDLGILLCHSTDPHANPEHTEPCGSPGKS